MAYDPNSVYQPPSRAYYGQTQQQAPLQNGYGNRAQEQYNDYYVQQPYDDEDEGYGQQQYSQSNGNQDMRAVENPQSLQFSSSDGFYGSQRNPKKSAPQQPGGYEAQQQGSERQYDPRYQQRPDRGRQPNQGQQTPAQAQFPVQPQQTPERGREQSHNQHRPVAGQHPPYDQPAKAQQRLQKPAPETQHQMQQARPNPRDARTYAGGAQPQRQNFDPQSAPQRPSDPAKMTMEEWKAREKARMHAEAMLPETIAQDNAFPVFPTNRERSKVRSGTASPRASGELPRPGTSSGNRHDRKSSKSRAYSDSNAANPAGILQQPGRPSFDYQPRSADQIEERVVQPQISPPLDQQPQQSWKSKYFVSNPDQPIQDPVPPPRSPNEEQRLPSSARSEWMQTSSQANGPVPSYTEQTQNGLQASPYASRPQHPIELPTMARTPPPPVVAGPQNYPQTTQTAYEPQTSVDQPHSQLASQPRQAPQRAPPPQVIDTSQAQQQPRPAYLDHQPLSPGQVSARPSTSHGQRPPAQRSPLGESMTSPISAYPPSQIPQDYQRGRGMEASSSWAEQHTQEDPLDSIYGHYQETRTQTAVAAPPRNREEEIEAAMPDFDSAAPGGTSLLHKRSQPFKETPASAPPAMPHMAPQNTNFNPRGFAAPQQRGFDQQMYQPIASPTDQRPQGGITNGQVYGLPGQNNPRKYGASYDPIPPPQQTYQQLPPQPPFANEQPRRSMDDARQMQYPQGPPPGQHPQPNSRPPPGSMRQHRTKPRPGNAPNFTDLSVQTSWANPPPQDRIGSAPPIQQNFRAPPLRADNNMQVTRQYSNPEQPAPVQRRSDPDSLPQHPTPVRPGHMPNGPGQPSKPPPVRNHDNVPAASHQRKASIPVNSSTRPVTAAELDQLRSAVDANPNDHKRTMLLVKKLVEASTVLVSEGGRADARTQAKNRERYIMDADKRLRKLVAAGYADAQFFLADCYGQGTMGLPVNPKEAFTLYQAAAKAGHAEAAYRTAMCCELGPEDGGTSKDFGKAVQWYRRGAALGDPDAMFKIGIILLKGLLGQPRNIGEAVNFLKRAVEQSGQNNPHALFELAQLYESTETNREIRNKVIPDDAYALELFQQAANAGHKSAQFRLGQAYEYGNLSAPIDNRSSITWYTKAAAQGEHQAELALSGWYLTGSEGVLKQSDTEAYLWARKAACSEPPLAKAMFALGYFTETGIGCPKSMEEAKKWYARAAAYRFPKAQERLEELRRSGSKISRPVNGKLSRKDQQKDEENCVVM